MSDTENEDTGPLPLLDRYKELLEKLYQCRKEHEEDEVNYATWLNDCRGGMTAAEVEQISGVVAEVKKRYDVHVHDCGGRHVCPDCKEWCRSLDAHICGSTF